MSSMEQELQNYSIRLATERDLPQVVQLDHDAFAARGTHEPPEVFAARLRVFAEGFIVAEDKGLIIGYCTTEKWLDEREPRLCEDPFKTHAPAGKVMCLTALAVREGWHNQGIGSAMLSQLQEVAQQHQCKSIIVETTRAQRFYVRHGFQIIGERQQSGIVLTVLRLALQG